MKNLHLHNGKMWYYTIVVFLAIALSSCTKDDNASIDAKTTGFEAKRYLEYDVDARKATLYTLQYAQSTVYGTLNIEIGSKQTPTVIAGPEVISYIERIKLPYTDDEVAFIKELLQHDQAKAFIIRDLENEKFNKTGDVIYIPYPSGIEIPEVFVGQNGFAFNTFDDDNCTYTMVSQGATGKDCWCDYYYVCNYDYSRCFQCPNFPDDFIELFSEFLFHPELFVDNYSEPVNLNDLKPGTTIFDY